MSCRLVHKKRILQILQTPGGGDPCMLRHMGRYHSQHFFFFHKTQEIPIHGSHFCKKISLDRGPCFQISAIFGCSHPIFKLKKKWIYIIRKVPRNGCHFQLKLPLEMGRGSRFERHTLVRPKSKCPHLPGFKHCGELYPI